MPQGTTVGSLAVGTGTASASLYEPNQFVMACGVADFDGGPLRCVSPISRNLNSGDAIYLVVANPSTTNGLTLDTVIRYAVSFN